MLMMRTSATAAAVIAGVFVCAPVAAQAQDIPGRAEAVQAAGFSSCGDYMGTEGTTTPGPYEALPDEVVEIPSSHDGEPLQVGVVRPKLPEGQTAPVILNASPYQAVDLKEIPLADCHPWLVKNFVEHGYAVAYFPTRGSGDTGGCPNLFGRIERSDMDDVLTWLGTQQWSAGKIAMYGLSYEGSTPWVGAATGNPYLKTILPASGVNDLFDLAYGAGTLDWRWFYFVSGYYHYYALPFNNPALSGRDAQRTVDATANCPDVVQGEAATVESFATGERDAGGYWAERNLRPLVEQRYRGSVLLIQGLQDFNVRPAHTIPWTLSLQRHGVRVHQMLGQWKHAVPDGPNAEMGVRNDFADYALAWFDRELKGDDSVAAPAPTEVQGTDGRWRRADSWPPDNDTALHLTPAGNLAAEPSADKATAVLAPDARSRHFFLADDQTTIHDAVPVPSAVDELCATCVAFSLDAPAGLRVSGRPRVRLQVTPLGPAGHVTAFLYRRDADGLHRLGFGETDLRFPAGENSGVEKAAPVTPGAPVDVTIELEPLEGVVKPGEQLVLVLGQGNSSQMPARPAFPVVLKYGAGAGALELAFTDPPAETFFTPPSTPPRPLD